MKTKWIIAILVVVLLLWGATAWIKANYFEAGSYLVTKSTDVDTAYRLNVKGEDLRVYEFTPKGAPEKLCVFVAGTNKGDMECIDKR